jgi:hypothetical protein
MNTHREPDEPPRRGQRLRRPRHLADELLSDVDELRKLEEIKREYPVATPEYHYLAEEIERRSRAIFRRADDALELDEQVDPGEPKRTSDREP